mmetsp:Transcript_51802/g.150453  ORF Transcript_51802/g.150453 Transcript_51802/m.150453 type:complete len:532 (-) Transcript_51802:1059-2654(-)
MRVVDDVGVVLGVSGAHAGQPSRARGPWGLHEVQEDAVALRGQQASDLGNHRLIQLADAGAGVPELPGRFVRQLYAHDHAGRGGPELVAEHELCELQHDALATLVVAPHSEELRALPLAREALVPRLRPGQRVEVQHAAHAAHGEPAQQPREVALAAIDKAVRGVVVHKPIAQGNPNVRDAELLQPVQVLLGDEAVPVLLHQPHGTRVLWPTVLLDQCPLIRHTLVGHHRGPHPLLQEEPAAEVHAHEGRAATQVPEGRIPSVLEEVCLDRVRWDGRVGCTWAPLELEAKRPFTTVEHHGGHEAVGPEEGRGQQAVLSVASAQPPPAAASAATAPEWCISPAPPRRGGGARDGGVEVHGAGEDELGEVPDEVVLWVPMDLACGKVSHHGGVPDVVLVLGLLVVIHQKVHGRVPDAVHVVGPDALVVDDEVPVDPSDAPGVQVAHDVLRVALAQGPLAGHGRGALGPAPPPSQAYSLARQQLGVRHMASHTLQGLEVPVRGALEGDANGVAGGGGVGLEELGPPVGVLLAVV